MNVIVIINRNSNILFLFERLGFLIAVSYTVGILYSLYWRIRLYIVQWRWINILN